MILTIKPLIYKVMEKDLIDLGALKLDNDDEDYIYVNGKRKHRSRYGKDDVIEIDLQTLTRGETEKILAMMDSTKVHGSQVLASDIRKYLLASANGNVDGMHARTVRQAAWMLEHYFSQLAHHTIFSVDDYGGNSHSGYYIGDVDYEPEKRGDNRNYNQLACVYFHMWHIQNDERRRQRETWYAQDCVGMTCDEMLLKAGYVPENAKLMAKLRSETERYYAERAKVGTQYVAVGLGLCDLDDALAKNDKKSYWSWRGDDKLQLDQHGETRVVVDVLKENDKKKNSEDRRSSGESPDPYRWHKWNSRFHSPTENTLVRYLDADEDTVEPYDIDIPVHPLVPCFDLRRHVRLRVHVNNLTPYQYNREAAKNLILPERDWKMIDLLVDQSTNDFRDIVSNKGQSMNILAAGPPGTGKTLSAEVFAEFKGMPLYTIQCAQLGMAADTLENNLGIVLTRANRWNTVLLLDEADVYIRKRGTDLNQNAIVGSFLRVLEYASCILFMTTNLEESVDDAITSRCIAKLTYGPPSTPDQAKIWRILADLNKLKMSDAEIMKIAKTHPHLSGRDVKNLLKLASFVSANNGLPLTAETVEFAMQFKPTENFHK